MKKKKSKKEDKKKSILIFVDWFAPAYKAGGPIRSCVNFSYAMRDDFQINIITSNIDINGEIIDVKSNNWNKFDENINIIYLSKNNQNINRIKELIIEVNPDFIYLNSMFSSVFTLIPLYLHYRKLIDTKIVLAPRGMLQKGALKYKYFKKKIYLNILSLLGIFKTIYFHATDEQEKKDIIKQLKVQHKLIYIAANFPLNIQKQFQTRIKQPGIADLIFISRVSPKKNLTFFLNRLKESRINGKITLKVFGVLDEDYWLKCKRIIKDLPDNICVDYGGSINPEKVPDILMKSHLFVLPTYGENYGHAIFESFSAGRPVIISDKTPWRQLANEKVGWDISLMEIEMWDDVIEKIINFNQTEFDDWAKNAWNFANKHIQNSRLKEHYLKLFS